MEHKSCLLALIPLGSDKTKSKSKLYSRSEFSFTPFVVRTPPASAIPKEKLLSCSIGISELLCNSKDEIDETLRQADKALYIVKRRNKGGYELINRQ